MGSNRNSATLHVPSSELAQPFMSLEEYCEKKAKQNVATRHYWQQISDYLNQRDSFNIPSSGNQVTTRQMADWLNDIVQQLQQNVVQEPQSLLNNNAEVKKIQAALLLQCENNQNVANWTFQDFLDSEVEYFENNRNSPHAKALTQYAVDILAALPESAKEKPYCHQSPAANAYHQLHLDIVQAVNTAEAKAQSSRTILLHLSDNFIEKAITVWPKYQQFLDLMDCKPERSVDKELSNEVVVYIEQAKALREKLKNECRGCCFFTNHKLKNLKRDALTRWITLATKYPQDLSIANNYIKVFEPEALKGRKSRVNDFVNGIKESAAFITNFSN